MAPGNVVYNEVFELIAFAKDKPSVFNEALFGYLNSVRESHWVIGTVDAVIYRVVEIGFKALCNELVDGFVAGYVDYNVEGVLHKGLTVLADFWGAEVID